MLRIQKFTFNPFQENTYVIVNGSNAILIDPGMSDKTEELQFNSFLVKNNLTLKAVWLTHAHVDHIMGIHYIQTQFDVPFYMHSLEQENLTSGPLVAKAYGIPFNEFEAFSPLLLDEMDCIAFNNENLEIIFAPGHSAGSVCFYHKDTAQLIGGDVLFRQSIGRTDLPGGNFETLNDSIQKKLYLLPDETTVFSGHGPETSIGYEKVNNAFVKALK